MGCEAAFGRFCFFYPSFSFKDRPLNIWAYIDGFNLYNGALKGTPPKWLDLETFSQRLRPADQVSKVKFFTAQVDPRFNDPQQPVRQRLYWRAIRTLKRCARFLYETGHLVIPGSS